MFCKLPPTCALDAFGTDAYEGSNATVTGGIYTCKAVRFGGFLFAVGRTRVKITSGLFQENVSGWKGGAIYCDGADGSLYISIEGGMFRNNEAHTSGGAIALWGTDVVAMITGGTFAGNTAT